MDRYMDSAPRGPLFLKRDEIGEIVVEALFEGARLGHYVGAFCCDGQSCSCSVDAVGGCLHCC
jgi:hypothetical protein